MHKGGHLEEYFFHRIALSSVALQGPFNLFKKITYQAARKPIRNEPLPRDAWIRSGGSSFSTQRISILALLQGTRPKKPQSSSFNHPKHSYWRNILSCTEPGLAYAPLA